jgi:hypothetical protein
MQDVTGCVTECVGLTNCCPGITGCTTQCLSAQICGVADPPEPYSQLATPTLTTAPIPGQIKPGLPGRRDQQRGPAIRGPGRVP